MFEKKRDYGKAESQIFGGILCLTIIRTSRIRTTSAITAQRTTPRIQPILRIPRIIRIPRTPRILRTPEMNTKTATISRTAVTIPTTAANSNWYGAAFEAALFAVNGYFLIDAFCI